MHLLWNIFKRFLKHKRALLLGFLAIPGAQIADISVTWLIGNAITDLDTATDTEFLTSVLWLMALFAVVHTFMRFFQRWLIVVVSRRVEVELKLELFDKLTSLPFSFHNSSRSGDVVSRLTSDVENVRMLLGPGLMYTLGAIIVVPISLVLLYSINPTLALLMLLPMFCVVAVMRLFTPRLHRHSVAVQESLADISHRAQENFSGIRIVKGYSREDSQAKRFGESSDINRHNQIELACARGLTHAAVRGAHDMTFVLILAMGGLAAIDRTMVTGDLFKFIDLTFKVFWPMIAVGWIAGMYPRAVASARRIHDLLDRSSDILDPEQPTELAQVRGQLDMENVGFTYDGTEEPAISGLNLHVPAGTTLGIVGPTGCGKSTLLNLLGRMYDVGEGELRLDGIPIKELSLQRLRTSLGYVPQDSFLFSERYRDNINFGAEEELSEEALRTLIERASMTEEVANFPDDIEQMIGERGVTLSGGQRQRTCIARALARDPAVLVLDDCLSAVDTETEKRLIGHLRKAGQGRTVIVSAHRLSTVAAAEQILVMSENGKQEALGTHAELVNRAGWYQRTWRQQQRREELSEL